MVKERYVPENIKTLDFRFIRVAKGNKNAIDSGWADKNNYSIFDSELEHILGAGYNYGVMLPQNSSVVIIDADEYERIVKLGCLDGFPETFTVKTGSGGYHIYYRVTGNISSLGSKKYPFYDFELVDEQNKQLHLGEVYTPGSRAYVVGPSCLHPNGNSYEIVNDKEIASISIEMLDDVFFSKVESSRFNVKTPDKSSSSYSRSALTDELGLRIEDFVSPVDIKVRRQSGDIVGSHPLYGSTTGINFAINPQKNAWFSFRANAGGDPVSWIAYENGWVNEGDPVDGEAFKKVVDYLRNDRRYTDRIVALEHEWKRKNVGLSDPSIMDGAMVFMDDSIISRPDIALRSVATYIAAESKTKGVLDIAKAIKKINNDKDRIAEMDRLSNNELIKIATDAWEARPLTPKTATGERIDSRWHGLARVTRQGTVQLEHSAIAQRIIDTNNLIAFGDQLWVYDEGVYNSNEAQVNYDIKQIVDGVGYKGSFTDALRQVKAHISAHDVVNEYPFNCASQNGSIFIPAENCVVEIDSNGSVWKREHSPKYKFTMKIPVEFNPDADSTFIDDTMSGYVKNGNPDVLYQIPAQAIMQMNGARSEGVSSIAKKSYILQGNAHAGKSTYLDWIRTFFGNGNVSQVPFGDLGGDNRFALAGLEGKALNIHDDLGKVGMSDSGRFKALTGSYSHQIEKKGKQAYTTMLHAVHVFSCNKPPKMDEHVMEDSAFWERIEYVLFPNEFPKDPSWIRKLYTAENKSAFLNKIIDAIVRIMQSGSLIVDTEAAEVREYWEADANPVYGFVNETFSAPDQGVRTLMDKGEVLDAFQRYCKDKGLECTITTVEKMSRELFAYGFSDTKKRGLHVYKCNRKPIAGGKYSPFIMG